MLVDDTPERSRYVRLTLERLGYDVVAEVSNPRQLHDEVLRLSPDAIIVDTDSPSRDTLENICLVTESCPRPIVMFSQDGNSDSIREAVRAGVSAYVVDGLEPERVAAIVEVACARFDEFQRLRSQLAEANRKLSERKLVERAKGLLMKERRVSEQEAYELLRSLAMNRGKRIGDVAQDVITAVELLGRA